MEGHLFDIQPLLKNGQKYDSFAAHFEKYFSSTTSHTDLHKFMTLKVVKHLNLIRSMKIFMKPKWRNGKKFSKSYVKNAPHL